MPQFRNFVFTFIAILILITIWCISTRNYVFITTYLRHMILTSPITESVIQFNTKGTSFLLEEVLTNNQLLENEDRDIEKVIKFGKLIREGNYLTYYAKGEKFDSFKDLDWVRLDKNKRVVLFD